MIIKFITVGMLGICTYWTARNIGPQFEAEAWSVGAKSMFMIIMMFIAILLVLKSPWCPACL